MITYIPPEITIASFSLISVLIGYVWNDQGKKLDKIEQVQKARPCVAIHLRIEKMATDIEWIKDKLKNETY